MIQRAVGTELVAWGGTNASGTWVGRQLGRGGALGDGQRRRLARGHGAVTGGSALCGGWHGGHRAGCLVTFQMK
jgi:hypothetical protein